VALSFGSQLDGLVVAAGDGSALHPALIWADRRAGKECEAAAERMDPDAFRALTGCNLDPGHVGAKIAWLARHEPEAHGAAAAFVLPGSWVAWRVSGILAVDPSNGSSMGLLDPRTREWAPAACTAFGVDPAHLAPVQRPDTVLGPILSWLQEATGLDARTLVVLGAGDEMAATLGAGVVEPGVVCDVMGTAEPVCAVVAEPAHDPTGLVELHPHADPETWLLENPGWLSGGAYRWFRDELGGPEAAAAAQNGADVYELLNALAECAPPGAGGVSWVPALAGATAPEWNAHARAGWFGLTASHGRAHLARALLEGNALALRDVIEAIGGAGHPPSEVVCVGGGAKGRLLCELRAHVTGLPVCRPDDVETTARGAAMLAAAGAGLHPTVAAAARAMAGPRSAHVHPDPELRAVYDDLHVRHRRLYAALRPLFDAEVE
jgi:xylulokinase